MIKTSLLIFLLSFGVTQAASNSKGLNSPLAVGVITAVSADGKSITILQGGELRRELAITADTKIIYVGMPKAARHIAVGYGVKASVKEGVTKTIRLTQATKPKTSMGKDRHKMSVKEILAKADDNGDGRLDYVELSRWIYHSAKHGPDKYSKIDTNNDGLDAAELEKLLSGVSWWKYSRKPAAAWFKSADKNKDQTLDLKEFTTIASGKSHAENSFKRTDSNKDKQLSPEEVSKYVAGLIGGNPESDKKAMRKKKKK